MAQILIERSNIGGINMSVMNPYNYKKPIGTHSPTSDQGSAEEIANNINAGMKTKTDSYLEHRIMNAKPEELTLMLYEGIMKFVNQSILFNEQKMYEKSNNSNLRAQAILQELRSSLNMEIEMSTNLENLYLFMMDHLIDANFKKSEAEESDKILKEVLSLATDLRDTWKEAMRL